MLARLFHRWERRLAATADRPVRPLERGSEWIHGNGHSSSVPPEARLSRWVTAVMEFSDRFYAVPPTAEYRLSGELLTFPSTQVTPCPANNTVFVRRFLARSGPRATSGGRRAVLVLPQWNADVGGHVGLCRLLAILRTLQNRDHSIQVDGRPGTDRLPEASVVRRTLRGT